MVKTKTHNSEFITCNCTILHLWEKRKKSELLDINSQLWGKKVAITFHGGGGNKQKIELRDAKSKFREKVLSCEEFL